MKSVDESRVVDPTAPLAVAQDGHTRSAVVKLLLSEGPISATAIGDQLGLTPAGVRRHLEALLEDGLAQIVTENWRNNGRGRGRPAKLYQLTAAGRNRLNHAYDDLATSAMRELRNVGGDAALSQFATKRVERILATVEPATDHSADSLTAKAEEIADAFSSAGFAATTRDIGHGSGVQICQHHCPVSHVAEEFPELCDAEIAAFRDLLGTHVQRLATIANGDCACTTHVPLAAPQNLSSQPMQGSTSEGKR